MNNSEISQDFKNAVANCVKELQKCGSVRQILFFFTDDKEMLKTLCNNEQILGGVLQC